MSVGGGQKWEEQVGSLEGLLAVDGEQEELARIGGDMVNRLFVLVRNTLLFNQNNEALLRPVAALLQTFDELQARREEQAALALSGDNIALNKLLLKPDPATFGNACFLGRIYQRLGALELAFDTRCTEAQLRVFMETLRAVVEGKQDRAAMSKIPGMELVPLQNVAEDDEVEIDRRIQVLRVFAGAVAAMARVMALVERRKRWSPAFVRRIAYDLSDAAVHEPDLLLGLLHLPVSSSPLAAHLVRTASLAFLCAQRVGLGRRGRAEAAMVALSHHLVRPLEADLGGASVIQQTDPLEAALALCSRGGLNEGLIRRVVGVYEATGAMGDRTDLYQLAAPGDLLGRIVFVADRYTTLLDALRPDEALRVLLLELQEREPELTLIFVTTVGLYPVGTTVMLQSGARATVVQSPRRHEHLLAPVVRLIDDPAAGPVDLSKGDHDHGGIATVSKPVERLNVSHLFML